MIHANNVFIGNYAEENNGIMINKVKDINMSNGSEEGSVLNISYIPQLNDALDTLQRECNSAEGKERIKDIRREFEAREPSVGRIRAAFNVLKRTCTNKNFLEAAKVFGDLLIRALK